jgi:helicase required for RNAi-mediated heterochromatin assembly 1
MIKITRQEKTEVREILRRHIYKTYEVNAFAEEWRNLPEVPSSSEIAPPSKGPLEEADKKHEHPESWNDYQQEPLYDENLPHNIIKGPWPSKEAYIGAHYQILREDAIAPLRRSVADVKKNPGMQEDGDTCIYTQVSGFANSSINLLTI